MAGSLRPVNAQRFWQRRLEAPTLQAGLSKDRHPWLHWVKNPNPQCHFPLILLLLLHQKVRLVQDLSYKFSWNQNKILFLPFSLFFFSLPCETCIMLPLSSFWPDQALFRQTADQNRNSQQVQEAVQPFLAASWKLCGRTATDAKTGCLSAFHFNPFLTTFRLDRCSRVTHRDFVADARVANQGSWQSHTVTAHVEVAHKTHLEIRLG